MSFTSYSFIGFIFICIFLYYVIPKKYQSIVLLIASYIFYFCLDIIYPLYILITSYSTYFAAKMIEDLNDLQEKYIDKYRNILSKDERKEYKSKIKNYQKSWLIICIILNFGILAYTKYTNFFIENFNNLSAIFHINNEIQYKDIIIPLGISFYTFQSIGYLLDVYWKKCNAQQSFLKFCLFVSFFPQLGQGPISRYNDLSKTLYIEHEFNWLEVRFGLERILWGYFKKLVIADRIYIALNMITSDPDYYKGGFVFIGMIFYSIQLYADFTGGIDITIGIAQCFRIKIMENFQRPFFSKSIKEYWRRWHISMGTWFRDYLFYPLSISKPLKNLVTYTKKHFGINIAKRVSVYFTTLILWLVTGIWHGASWNFVIWGMLNGIVILISEECEPLYKKFHNRFPKLKNFWLYKLFQVMRTILLMSSLRIFDCYIDVKISIKMYFSIFTQFNLSALTKQEFLDMGLMQYDYIIVFLGVMLMIIVSMLSRNGSLREKISKKPYIVKFTIWFLLFFTVLMFGQYGIGYDATQFIYNQF